MAVGIGASVTTISDGTTAHANDVLNSLSSLNSLGLSNDGVNSTNGAGVTTLAGLVAGASGIVNNGILSLIGQIILAAPSVQSLSSGNTITLPGGPWVRVSATGSPTGIIMTAGSTTGQLVILTNSGTSQFTFAASGSNVRNGSNVVVTGGRILIMVYDGSQWITSANP